MAPSKSVRPQLQKTINQVSIRVSRDVKTLRRAGMSRSEINVLVRQAMDDAE